jgi:hypothetical protein
MKNSKKAHETAEKRMGIIAPLLAAGLDKAEVRKLRDVIGETHHISQRTLDRYLHAYHVEGFSGLLPEGKNSSAKYKIPPDIVEAAIQLRRELPSRSVPTIIEILELEGKVEKGFLKRTTLQDALQREGYSAGMMKVYRDPAYGSQRFQRLHRNDLWQGDIKYGPTLKINGLPTPTYLSCLIDDATRMILHGEFYSNMTEAIVEDTLHKAIVKYGAPKRLYFDNGSQYRTHWMKRACTLLGIKLMYARPRNPQGKGKQEHYVKIRNSRQKGGIDAENKHQVRKADSGQNKADRKDYAQNKEQNKLQNSPAAKAHHVFRQELYTNNNSRANDEPKRNLRHVFCRKLCLCLFKKHGNASHC